MRQSFSLRFRWALWLMLWIFLSLSLSMLGARCTLPIQLYQFFSWTPKIVTSRNKLQTRNKKTYASSFMDNATTKKCYGTHLEACDAILHCAAVSSPFSSGQFRTPKKLLAYRHFSFFSYRFDCLNFSRYCLFYLL